jgi:uncharacterized protein
VVSVTADSNIWVSAFSFPGKPRRLIEMADSGSVRIDISDAIIDEVLRVLRLKFKWPDESLAEAKSQMTEIGRRVTPGQRVSAVEADETDNRILECAEAAGSEYVVTGDKHLLQLGNFESTAIITVAAFLDKDAGRVASP